MEEEVKEAENSTEENISTATELEELDETLGKTNVEIYTGEKTQVIRTEVFENEAVKPLIFVESTVEDSTNSEFGEASKAKYANILSVVTQKGAESQQYVKAICGKMYNRSGGDNDATGVVGYAIKDQVSGGIGDTCGAGGAAWQNSTNKGLVLGGEFACHQQVKGTHGAPKMGQGNYSLALHLTTRSKAAPCWGALGIDGFGLDKGHYGFWKGISVQESCWNHNNSDEVGENNDDGIYIEGTTGIDFSTNKRFYPENEIELGNAVRHLKREKSGQAIRYQASYHDFCPNTGEDLKVRFFINDELNTVNDETNNSNVQSEYNIQLLFEDGEMKAETGKEADVQKTEGRLRNSIISFGNDHVISVRTYEKNTGKVYTVAMDPKNKTFRPGTSGTVSLGTSSHRFSQVYADNGEINVSDARQKTDIEDVDVALMRAWSKISYKTFKMRSAVQEKGVNARVHIGLIAQEIIAAFESEGLDAFEYGIVCRDTWKKEEPIYDSCTEKLGRSVDEETGEILREERTRERKEVLAEGREAGELLSIRYNECLALEAAYQRWRLEQLEKLLEAKS